MDAGGSEFAVVMLAYSPVTGVFTALPTGLALGLGPASAVFWTVLGNAAAGATAHFAVDSLQRIRPVAAILRWLDRERVRELTRRYGYWALLLGTPLLGIWSASLAGRVVNLAPGRALLASVASAALYSIVMAALIQQGLSWAE